VYVNKHEYQSENITEFWTMWGILEAEYFITGIRHTIETAGKQIA
jgi:hypothetical protein